MPRKKNVVRKKSFEFTYDRYIQAKFDYIMASGLFDTKADAVKAAIVELANLIKHDEYKPKPKEEEK
jgi:hypothetical protein